MGEPPVHALFGGTFDPIHNGHLHIARALRDELQLTWPGDQVSLLPTGQPPHRDTAQASPAERLAMCQLAVSGETGLAVDAREVFRTTPCYTVDTLADIRQEVGSEAPVVFLIGGDSLQQLHRWRDWQGIVQQAHLVVAQRPGSDLQAGLHPDVADWVSKNQLPPSRPRLSHGKIYVLSAPPVTVSATDLRQRLALGEPTAGLLPDAVRRFIFDNGLYHGAGRN